MVEDVEDRFAKPLLLFVGGNDRATPVGDFRARSTGGSPSRRRPRMYVYDGAPLLLRPRVRPVEGRLRRHLGADARLQPPVLMPFFAELADEPTESLPQRCITNQPARPGRGTGCRARRFLVARTEQTVVPRRLPRGVPRGVSLAVLAMAQSEARRSTTHWPSTTTVAGRDFARDQAARRSPREAHDNGTPQRRVTTRRPSPTSRFPAARQRRRRPVVRVGLGLAAPAGRPWRLYFRWDDRGIPGDRDAGRPPLAAAAADAYEPLWLCRRPSYAVAARGRLVRLLPALRSGRPRSPPSTTVRGRS